MYLYSLDGTSFVYASNFPNSTNIVSNSRISICSSDSTATYIWFNKKVDCLIFEKDKPCKHLTLNANEKFNHKTDGGYYMYGAILFNIID